MFDCIGVMIGTFGHGFTYGGHPVSCAVSLETLRIYKYAIMSMTQKHHLWVLLMFNCLYLIPIQLLIHDLVGRERDILQHVNAVAPAFQKGMKELAKSPIVGEVNWFWV